MNRPSNKTLSFILSIAAGLMISIVCFELIPEATEISGWMPMLMGCISGIIVMIYCDIKVRKSIDGKRKMSNSLLKIGIIVGIGLAIHNIPEGLAIGTGFESSIKLGYSLAIAIAIHDIPEGMSMAVPLKNGGIKSGKILMCVILSGITTGIGALIGALIGCVSNSIIGYSLAFAAGAMLYIVSGELTPEYSKLYSGKISTIGNIIGVILGYIATQI